MPIQPVTIPKNWAKMFNIDKEENIDNMFLIFRTYPAPVLAVENIGRDNMYSFPDKANALEQYNFFYPKDNISEKIDHVYSENNSAVIESLTRTRQAIGGKLGAAVQISTAGRQGVLHEEPFLYSKTERRSFSINLMLIAYSDLEEDIYGPIKFFRNNSYPTRLTGTGITTNIAGGQRLGRIQNPNIFRISGGLFNTNQVNDSFYILNNINVDYNTDIKFLKEGYPMQAMLTLDFTELVQMYADKFRAVEAKINVKLEDQEVVSQSLSDVVKENIQNTIKNSPIVRAAKNAPTIIEQEVKRKVTEMVKENPLYKQVTSITDIDPRQRLEVEKITNNSPLFKKILNITDIKTNHKEEVDNILRKIRG